MQMISVRFVNGFCTSCQKVVQAPNLGEFDYGYLIFTGLKGNVYARAQVIADPVAEDLWRTAESIIAVKDRGELLQRIVAACADPIEGQSLTSEPICPHCLASAVVLSDDYSPGFCEIAIATFNRYAGLSQQERERSIRSIINEIKK